MALESEWARDGKTHDSGSAISGLSSVDDDTDEFGRMLLQHVKDEQRLGRALNGPEEPFRKARPHLGIGAALQQLNGARHLPARSISSSGSDPGVAEPTWTAGSDPPLNIPRGWGSKARQSHGWLHRLDQLEAEDEIPAGAEQAATPRGNGIGQGSHVQDWASTADRYAYGADQATPLSSKSRRVASSPAQGGQNNSIERIRQWEAEQDFTAGSFLQSTPMVTSRKREPDSIRQQSVARAHLSRISEKTTPDTKGDQLESRLSHIMGQSLTRRRPSPSDNQRWAGSRARVRDKENVPIEHMDAAIKHEPTITNGLHPAHRTATASRPITSRLESVQLLKRLAGISGPSPDASPNTVSRPPAPAFQPAPSQRQSSANAPELVNSVHETPRPATQQPPKTPKVTGAWISTPQTTRHDSVEPIPPSKPVTAQPAPREEEALDIPRPASAPPPPPSALSSLLSRSGPQGLGDDTLASLQALLDPDDTLTTTPTTAAAGDVSATLDLQEVRAELDKLHALGRPLTHADEARRDELLAIEGMAGRLRSARRGVREVKRGLRGMEKRVELTTQGQQQQQHGPAPFNAGPGGDDGVVVVVWRALLNEARSLCWDATDGAFTTLGALLALLAAWYLVEKAAAALLLQPRFAPDMVGFGVDPTAPRYPFVLPSLLLRPVRWLWRPVTGAVGWVLAQLWSGLVAYLGILFEEDKGKTPAHQPVRRAAVKPSSVRMQSRRSGMWQEEDAVIQAREKTEVQWKDRAGRGAVQETMDEDGIVREERRLRGGGEGFGIAKRLWSWKGSPAEEEEEEEAAASAVSMQTQTVDTWGSEDVWSSAQEVAQVDTQPLWETGDGTLAEDEPL